MCCGGSSSTQKLPGWLESAGKDVVGKAKSFYESPYATYSGPRQAGFTGDQTTAFQQLRDFVSGGGTSGLATEGTGMIRSGATAPARQISTERIVDETGQLGAMADYINPNVAATLNPALRAIDEGAAAERNRIGDLAIGANAFGDARHGVLEKDLAGEVATARGDVTARAFSDAWNNAMAARSADADRFFNADVTNANLYETGLGRLMEGGGALTGQATTQQNDLLARLSALLDTGTQQQQQAQTALDIPYQEFEKKKQDEYDRLAALVSSISQAPYTRTTTTNDGGAGLLGGLGSLIGAFL